MGSYLELSEIMIKPTIQVECTVCGMVQHVDVLEYKQEATTVTCLRCGVAAALLKPCESKQSSNVLLDAKKEK